MLKVKYPLFLFVLCFLHYQLQWVQKYGSMRKEEQFANYSPSSSSAMMILEADDSAMASRPSASSADLVTTVDDVVVGCGRIFVVGCGHSGTSLLQRTVTQLPGIYCPVEIESLIFILGRPQDAVDKIMNQWSRETLKRGFTQWSEKTPTHITRVREILAMKNTKVVYIIRDGRAVANSIARRYSFASGFKRWVDHNHVIEPFLNDERVLTIRYEDLSSTMHNLETLRTLHKFVNGHANISDERLLASMAPVPNADAKANGGKVKNCHSYNSESEKEQSLQNTSEQIPTGEMNPRKHNQYRSSQMGLSMQLKDNFPEPNLTASQWEMFQQNEIAMGLLKRHRYIIDSEENK